MRLAVSLVVLALAGGSQTAWASPSLEILRANSNFNTLAVDAGGAAYGISLNSQLTDSRYALYRSLDEGETWQKLHVFPSNTRIWYVSVLSNGTILAHLGEGSGRTLWRSGDGGASWGRTFSFPSGYRSLGPFSVTDDGRFVYVGSYTPSSGDNTNWVWRSSDDGRTWQVVDQTSNHRHIHFVQSNPYDGRVYAGYGDTPAQSGIAYSADHGLTWQTLCSGHPCKAVTVDFAPSGYAVYAMDVGNATPYLRKLDLATGTTRIVGELACPSFSSHYLGDGRWLIGESRTRSGSYCTQADNRTALWASDDDGESFTKVFTQPIPSSTDPYHLVVHYNFPSGAFPIQLGGAGTVVARLTGGDPGDTTAPSPPTGLTAGAGDATTIVLDWSNNSEPDLAGYNVYRSSTQSGAYTKLNSALVTASQYTDTNAPSNATSYYKVTAVDTSTNESARSSAASATTPAPPSGGTGPFESFTTDPGCGGCSLGWSDPVLTATIARAANHSDTAYATEDAGASGIPGRVYVRTVFALASGQTLDGQLFVAELRDIRNDVVWQLFLNKGRVLRLKSPAGGLRSTSIGESTGITIPNNGTSQRIEVSALRNGSVVVRVGGIERVSIGGLSGATTANPRSLRVGVLHYSGTSTRPVTVRHASVGISPAGWLGAP